MSVSVHDFLLVIDKVDNGIRELMETLKEHGLPEVQNGVRRYYADIGKTPFQVSGQFERPDEFLQVLLDMVRVQYEPFPMGSMALNSNLTAYLHAAIRGESFRIGYLSMLSEEKQSFTDFWQTEVMAYAKTNGYQLAGAQVMFVVITAGGGNYGLPLLMEVNEVLDAGISLKEAESGCGIVTDRFSGFCLDEAMMSRLRVSVWFIYG